MAMRKAIRGAIECRLYIAAKNIMNMLPCPKLDITDVHCLDIKTP